MTPIEVWSSTSTVYFNLKLFGCLAYACVDNGKLEPRFVKCVFLGYKNGVKGYKLWCPKIRKIIVRKYVIFDEIAMLQDLPTNDSCDTSQQKPGMQVELQIKDKACIRVYSLVFIK